MQLAVMSLNIKHGAHRDGRWPKLVALIRDVGPDVLCLQECTGWIDDDSAQTKQAAADLGMDFVRGGPGQVGSHTYIGLTRELTCVGTENHLYTFNGYTGVQLEIPGMPVPLVVINAALYPYHAPKAWEESAMLRARALRYGGLGILAGDLNTVPPGDPEPPWEDIYEVTRTGRCFPRTWRDAPWVADRRVGDGLIDCGFTDVAASLSNARNDLSLRAPTGHNGRARVDQIWVAPAVEPTIADYLRVPTGEATDHDGVYGVFDLERANLKALRKYV